MVAAALLALIAFFSSSDGGIFFGRHYDELARVILDTSYKFSPPQYDYGDPDYKKYEKQDNERFNQLKNYGLGDKGCPVAPKCDPNAKYRNHDGSCNNLKHPTWGMTNTPYYRLVPNRFADGQHAYPKSITGKDLPQPRILSQIFLPEKNVDDFKWTLLFMQWGQAIAHDLSNALDSVANPLAPTCCSIEGPLFDKVSKGEKCRPPLLTTEDKLYKTFGQKCFDFRRATTDVMAGCAPEGSVHEMLSDTTHFMDASLVYGSDDFTADELRQHKGGLLKVDMRHGKEWMPSTKFNLTEGPCISQKHGDVCYRSGDSRTNQNPGIAMVQTIFLREHNRIARELAKINPHWDDERLYQESRRIFIAMFQHINTYEWNPGLFGIDLNDRFSSFPPRHYVNEYDETVNPHVMAEYAHSASRFLHTAIQGKIKLLNEYRVETGELLLPEHMRDVSVIERDGVFDQLVRGHCTQKEHARDYFIDPQVSENLFRNPITSRSYGFDLKTIDIQRERDGGLGSYNDLRQVLGYPRASKFEDFEDLISTANAYRMSLIYEHPDDVDLTVAGFLEGVLNVPGPTFEFIMQEQIKRTRSGDRYFYEFSTSPYPFTRDQLAEIKKASAARMMCDHTETITKIQPRAFALINPIINPLVSCDNHFRIPRVNLEVFKESQ